MAKYDEPLFVLKYQDSKLSYRIFLDVVCVLIGPGLYFLVPVTGIISLLAIVFAVFMLFLGVTGIVETLSFREVRLYSDRIVQVRKSGDTEIELAKAVLEGLDDHEGGTKRRTISDPDAKPQISWLRRLLPSKYSIAYDESLADPEDAKQFNGWLAYLSGRKFQEIEQLCASPEKLVKKGEVPRTVTTPTLDESVFQVDPQSQAFDRTVNWNLVILIPVLLLPVLIFWLAVLWQD